MLLLNRSAIVVAPRQPFLDWLHSVDPTSLWLTLDDLTADPTIYLLPECEDDEAVAECLREFSEEIFAEQLDSWHRDRSAWPADRTFDAFRRWFDYRVHSMLMDLCDEPLIRECL